MGLSATEHAVLKIPWQLAYGSEGFAPLIPPMSNLVYDIEVIKIN